MSRTAPAIAVCLSLLAFSCSKSSKTEETDWKPDCLLKGKKNGSALKYLYGRVTFDPETNQFAFSFWATGNTGCDTHEAGGITLWTIPDADGKLAPGKYGVSAGGDFNFDAENSTLEITEADVTDPAKGVKGTLTVKDGKDSLDGSFTLKVCPVDGKPYKAKKQPAYEPKDEPLSGTRAGVPWKPKYAIAGPGGDKGLRHLTISADPLGCEDASKNKAGAYLEVGNLGWATAQKHKGKQYVEVTFEGGAPGRGWIDFEGTDVEKGGKIKFSLAAASQTKGQKADRRFEVGGTFTATICK